MWRWLWKSPTECDKEDDKAAASEKVLESESPSESEAKAESKCDLKPEKSSLPSTANATGSLKNKVALKPGHSLMDWIRFSSSSQNLSGTDGQLLLVSGEDLARHNQNNDCWVAVKGFVYNVTPYLDYHPGGVEELMRGAGKDATDLFNSIHPWVNYEGMLRKCLVGRVKSSYGLEKAAVN